jgi:hypothetical protein
MKKAILPFLLLNFFCLTTFADPGDSLNVPKKKYFTNRLQGSITLDGVPNEDAWNKVEFGGDFIQWQPNEGKAPSQPTQFKILYDDKFLYVAYWCHDVSPDSVIKRMGRRDQFPGDWVEINLDSYHDSRSGFSFTTSVSGVRSDEFISNNGNNWDVTFNPIWFAKTSMNEKGWTAEIKIPFSQLRYGNEKDKVWGIQVTRRLFRKEERSTWQFIPQTLGVWVSGFGELHGLKDIPFHRQVEIAPYIRTGVDKYKKQPGNPYADGTDHKLSGGLDGKVAVTNDLILDFTVNPDFGQVEADPSQVRIDGFQNFFEEQRPFFVESRSIFNYQLTGSIAGGDYDADLLFYSRRVGSSPHGFPNTTNGEYANSPQNTTILGATKFSGKTKKGLSIGILESITQREMATIYNNGQKRKEMVEPLTNYFVARMQKDYNNANTIIGGIFTAVNREKGLEDILHRKAYTGGVDFVHQWKRQTWYVRGNVIFSHVQGSKEAIHRTQTAFEHLFQRPGASEVEVDANRTSLTGMGSTIKFGKSGGRGGKLGQVLRFETGVTVRSPELELNDIGFMLSANEINHFTWVGLRYPRSFSIFRSAGINYNHWQRWDFSGKKIYQAFNTNGNVNFKNNWFAYTGFTWNTFDISNNALRGASALRRPTGLNISSQVRSDQRKKVYANANTNFFLGAENSVRFKNYGLTLNYIPTNALNLSLGVAYSNNWRKQDQFVSIRSYNGMQRVIVSEVRQKTLRFTGRFTYNITPDLTIQYYGQPYITRPLYKNFAYVTDALAKNFEDRFQPYASNQISLSNNVYAIDENTDGSTDYSFGLPDFNFVQFRSNLVARWEYKPGSELFLVWSQSNTANSIDELDTPLFNSLTDNAFANQARNIFLVKWTYRFLR